jgi:hypothetical protein
MTVPEPCFAAPVGQSSLDARADADRRHRDEHGDREEDERSGGRHRFRGRVSAFGVGNVAAPLLILRASRARRRTQRRASRHATPRSGCSPRSRASATSRPARSPASSGPPCRRQPRSCTCAAWMIIALIALATRPHLNHAPATPCYRRTGYPAAPTELGLPKRGAFEGATTSTARATHRDARAPRSTTSIGRASHR